METSIKYYNEGILSGDRVALSRAITLVESKLPEHQQIAEHLIESILPQTGKSFRIGITGVPGVGKSTFIDAFGTYLTQQGKKVAVLSIDPSSTKSRGSILGDKTRMERLSKDPLAYVRPSPSANHLGGVAQKTRESILLCEAAGYEIIIVETVGVGQSETTVRDLVDFFLLLMLAGGGDELQGIKRGIMEMADMLLINKVDGDNLKAGQLAKKEYQRALHLFPKNENNWQVPVETISALSLDGMPTIWQQMTDYLKLTQTNGWLDKLRIEQKIKWLTEALRIKLEDQFYQRSGAKDQLQALQNKIASDEISIRAAVNQLLDRSE